MHKCSECGADTKCPVHERGRLAGLLEAVQIVTREVFPAADPDGQIVNAINKRAVQVIADLEEHGNNSH